MTCEINGQVTDIGIHAQVTDAYIYRNVYISGVHACIDVFGSLELPRS